MNFRPLLFIAVGFILGVFSFEAYRSLTLPREPSFAALGILVGSALAIYFSLFRQKNPARTLFLAAFLLALLRMGVALPDNIQPVEYRMDCVVSAVSDNDPYTLTVSSVKLNGTKIRYKVRLKLKNKDVEPPKVGDRIETAAKIGEEKDEAKALTLLASGFGHTAECREYTVISNNNLPVTQALCAVRGYLKAKIKDIFEDNAPMVTAFLLGDRSEMDYNELESFRTAGIAHLLSLSGFHVGLMTGLLLMFFPKKRPKLRALLVVVFLLLYAAITAFPPSIIRASVMFGCVMIADAAERKPDALSSISLAALVILAISPFTLWSAGFRLSFAATLGIILISGTGAANTGSVILDRVFELVIVTLSASAATLLISARYFGYISTYSLFTNVISVPFYSIAILMSLAVLIIGFPLPFAARILSWIPDNLLNGINFVVSKTAQLPYARINVNSPPEIAGLLMLILIFLMSPYILRSVKQRVRISLPVFVLFAVSLVAGI